MCVSVSLSRFASLDCFKFPGCLASVCPCIVYAQNKARLEHLGVVGEPDATGGGSVCSGDCAMHACLTSFCLFGWALQASAAVIFVFSLYVSDMYPTCRSQGVRQSENATASRETGVEIVLQLFSAVRANLHRRAGRLRSRRTASHKV